MKRFQVVAPLLLMVILLGGCDEFFPSKSAIDTLALSPTNRFMKVNDTQQFTATATTVGGTASDVSSTATWSSSDNSIATVSTTGLVTAKSSANGVGTATITASSGGVTANAAITVTNSTLSSIAITPTNPVLTSTTTVQLTATGTFADNSTQNITNRVSWTTSNSAVATIDVTGTAHGVAAGSVTFTATAQTSTGQVTATINVTVN